MAVWEVTLKVHIYTAPKPTPAIALAHALEQLHAQQLTEADAVVAGIEFIAAETTDEEN